MNASECCASIGCNCGGTRAIEFINDISCINCWLPTIFAIGICCLIAFAIAFYIKRFK